MTDRLMTVAMLNSSKSTSAIAVRACERLPRSMTCNAAIQRVVRKHICTRQLTHQVTHKLPRVWTRRPAALPTTVTTPTGCGVSRRQMLVKRFAVVVTDRLAATPITRDCSGGVGNLRRFISLVGDRYQCRVSRETVLRAHWVTRDIRGVVAACRARSAPNIATASTVENLTRLRSPTGLALCPKRPAESRCQSRRRVLSV